MFCFTPLDRFLLFMFCFYHFRSFFHFYVSFLRMYIPFLCFVFRRKPKEIFFFGGSLDSLEKVQDKAYWRIDSMHGFAFEHVIWIGTGIRPVQTGSRQTGPCKQVVSKMQG